MNFTRFLCAMLASLLVRQTTCDADFPIVTITQGSLKGKKINSSDGEAYYGFQGIPDARPPLGDLRFKAPLPHEAWNGTLDAQNEGDKCKQFDSSQNEPVGSEDCLFINVYTPQVCRHHEVEQGRQSTLSQASTPHHLGTSNFVAIHKSFRREKLFHSPTSQVMQTSTNGPLWYSQCWERYIFYYDKNVLGFLSTEDGVISGNAGLKDQVLAFRWVQENIAAFGGDPERVTIAGYSAGGVSVQLHFLSPLTKGLFQGGIAQSGSVLNFRSFSTKARKNAFLMGSKFGFSGNSSEDLAQFLRSRDANELIRTSIAIDGAKSISPLYVPSVEKSSGEEMPFLTEHPVTLLDNGKFHNVPFVTGTTSAEGIYNLTVTGLTSGTTTLQDLDENFMTFLKPQVKFCQDDACAEYILEKVRSFYLGDEPLNQKTLNKFIELCTDLNYAVGVVIGARKMQPKTTTSIYLYNFVYDGGLANLKKDYPALRNISGVAHSDDIGYVFDVGLQAEENSTDAEVRSRMVTMWTNFVKTGNPTPEVTEDIPEWPPFTVESGDYLEIGSQLVVKKHIIQERVNFWESLPIS